ncbi:hypothetical protein [Nocardia heshunensis]
MRKMLGSAFWILLGVLAGIAAVVGAAYWMLYELMGGGGARWDGAVPFIANCPIVSPCVITSVPEGTPSLAVKGSARDTIMVAPVPTIAGLQSGDHVSCTLHAEVPAGGLSVNDLAVVNTVENCHRT